MLIFSSLFLLMSNAVTLRRDKSIFFSRCSIILFSYCSSLTLNIIYLLSLAFYSRLSAIEDRYLPSNTRRRSTTILELRERYLSRFTYKRIDRSSELIRYSSTIYVITLIISRITR